MPLYTGGRQGQTMTDVFDVVSRYGQAVDAAGGTDAWNAMSPEQRRAVAEAAGIDTTDIAFQREAGSRFGNFLRGTAGLWGAALTGAGAINAAAGAGAAGAAGKAAGGKATDVAGQVLQGGGGSPLDSLFSGPFTGGDLATLAQLGLGFGSAISGAGKQGEANAIQQRALAAAEAQEADRARLRAQLMGEIPALSNVERPNLSSLFRTENPFARASAPAAQPALTPMVNAPVAAERPGGVLRRLRR